MTTKDNTSDKLLYCSFCGKSQHEVNKLIAGPSVFICDECIDLCNVIVRDEFLGEKGSNIERVVFLRTPRVITGFLDQYVIGKQRQKLVWRLLSIITIKELGQKKAAQHQQRKRQCRTFQKQHSFDRANRFGKNIPRSNSCTISKRTIRYSRCNDVNRGRLRWRGC